MDNLEKIEKDIKERFPEEKQRTAGRIDIRVDFMEGGTEQTKREVTVLNYLSDSNNKLLEVAPSWAFLEYSKNYSNSKELLLDISLTLEKLIDACSIEVINRVGLRYINNVSIPEGNPLDWTKYFNKQLLGALQFSKKQKLKPSRVLNQIIVKYDDADLTFNYGITNKDYPNEIVSKEFLLDFDCHTRLSVESNDFDIGETAKSFNQRIESLFEASITDDFRKVLNKKIHD